MRLCEATMPDDSPSGVGCTGAAYSAGYSSRCPSIARRRRSSASSKGTVLIHVIFCGSSLPPACGRGAAPEDKIVEGQPRRHYRHAGQGVTRAPASEQVEQQRGQKEVDEGRQG